MVQKLQRFQYNITTALWHFGCIPTNHNQIENDNYFAVK